MEVKIMETQHMEVAMSEPCMTEVEPTNARMTPEVMYADAIAKSKAFNGLSQRAAQAGETFLAVHLAWAADLNTVLAVLLETDPKLALNTERQFCAIAGRLAQALALCAAQPHAQPLSDAESAVTRMRSAALTTLDEAAADNLRSRLPDLSHLRGLTVPTDADADADADEVKRQRLQDSTAERISSGLQRAALDAMAQASVLRANGTLDESIARAYEADLATFEAYLIEAAEAVGDHSCATVAMRWLYGCEEISMINALPADFAGAVLTIREALMRSVAPSEANRLRLRFLPYV